ncbi:MAG: D-tyrosyl-tRNA(Tyr) deacylase [Lactobacillales bacterium]|jgi:D-tyrosyl-tRNA(Tyr) deacylase|nr:D-tyrosyl-tRNA(Tyr) deacylase [Lactobacillales bacterium]
MKVVIQRVLSASVTIEGKVYGTIQNGFVILVGVHEEDTLEDVSYLIRKVSNLRVFEDDAKRMNCSILEVEGAILSISQFTLFAETRKGNRPSFIRAADPKLASELIEVFNEGLRAEGIKVKAGIFGADMKVQLVNDGPVTILMDSRER